jgi:RHS repeat-associated protein
VRNDTVYTHFDNGWVKTSADPWDIVTSYEYDKLGQQTKATLTSAGGSSSRTQTWTYYPDGKLKSHGNDGIPVGKHVVLVDNSDSQHVTTVGVWPASSAGAAGKDYQGYDYRTHAAGSGGSSFAWNLTIPQDGTYEVFVRYAAGAATNAPYKVEHNGGGTTTPVDQTKQAGQWVSVGSYAFSAGGSHKITLTDAANGTVVADAVKLVRDNSADTDAEAKAFGYRYDLNHNLVEIKDGGSGARTDTYAVTYNGLNQAAKLQEFKTGGLQNTTTFTYDANGNPRSRTHDDTFSSYEYDVRDLVSKITNGESPTDPAAKVTTFTYTPRADLQRQVQGNGNTVDYEYYLDGLIKRQVEKKSSGTLVAEHTLEYNANGHRTKDTSKVMNADNHSAYLDEVKEILYDPRDRVAKSTKKDASSGNVLETESYRHDANNNVVEQTVGGTTTEYRYDRNRLQSATASGATSIYNYDPFGRLDTVTFLGTQLEKYVYDGFDRVVEHRTPTEKTRYAYDPMDRTSSRTKKAGAAGEEKTDFNYLGLTEDVLSEEVAGKIKKSYFYGPFGGRLAQIKFKDDGGKEYSYYGYNPHSDVEVITDENGNTRSTYGYTAYGENDKEGFTGVDKPTGDPGGGQQEEPYNAYRFNGKRWDQASGDYDMGFRDYDPGLNRFLTRDLYNGALDDLGLMTDPWNNNRYAFAGGNPITFIEIDGHLFGMSLGDIGHTVLDVAGMVPVIGEAADLVNGAWYAAEGDWVNAGLSFAGAIPFAGWAATGTKYAVKYGDEALALARRGDDVPAPRAPDAPSSPKPDTPNTAKPDTPNTTKPGDAPTTCRTANSFRPDTPVLMADGTRKAIKDVNVGDRVLATDPKTGRTEARPVLALITGTGEKDLVEITVDIDGAGGTQTGSLIATDGHPFWVDDEGRWVDAEDLERGDLIRTPEGKLLEVVRAHGYRAHQRVHNLTVGGIHTYYVGVGPAAVLVHNCPAAGGGQPPKPAPPPAQPPAAPRNNPNLQPGNNPAAARGTDVHGSFDDAFDAIGYGRSAPIRGGKPDAFTPSGFPVEVKPYTKSGVKRGTRQLRKYMRSMGVNYGELWVYVEGPGGMISLQKYAIPNGPRRWTKLMPKPPK